MKAWRYALAMGALAIGLAAPAHAKVLYTAPSSDDFFGEKLYCNVVNTGSSTVNVIIEARYGDGTVQGMGTVSLDPGHYTVLTAGNNWTAMYCRFVIQGSSRGIRAEGVYVDPQTGNRTVSVPAR